MLLTADPCLPIENALPEKLELELLSGGTKLVVLLQPADDKRTLLLSQELGCVWEVLDDKEGCRAGYYGRETFEDEDPRPCRFAANASHV